MPSAESNKNLVEVNRPVVRSESTVITVDPTDPIGTQIIAARLGILTEFVESYCESVIANTSASGDKAVTISQEQVRVFTLDNRMKLANKFKISVNAIIPPDCWEVAN